MLCVKFVIIVFYVSQRVCLFIFRQFYVALKGEGSRSGHIYMVVVRTPCDVEIAAVHGDDSVSAADTELCGGYGCGASACAASHGDAAAPFPDTGAELAFTHKLRKLNVASLREDFLSLQYLS